MEDGGGGDMDDGGMEDGGGGDMEDGGMEDGGGGDMEDGGMEDGGGGDMEDGGGGGMEDGGRGMEGTRSDSATGSRASVERNHHTTQDASGTCVSGVTTPSGRHFHDPPIMACISLDAFDRSSEHETSRS